MAPKKKTAEPQTTTTEAQPGSSTLAPLDAVRTGPQTSRQEAGRKPSQGAPFLEPWMRQTVVLKLKEVDGRVPDMSWEVFASKMVLDHGFSKAETVSIHSFFTGMFYITFASINICKHYWEMVKAAKPDFPFARFVGNCPVQREERRVTISMRNPHIPTNDITTFLKHFCTVVRDPTHILDGIGFWTGKWSVIVRLHKDSSAPDRVQDLPQAFSLGNSSGLIFYPDMPQTCRKCSLKGHGIRDCKAPACRICRVAGHEMKDCPKKTICNLCGQADHVYKDCPMRVRTYASVAKGTAGA
ncbi:uncharacterized protein LOC142750545 [Rhinoderma darwinii]|uniref:uncharacterized protein LOC142750545 n=1 Tax=Rhinoderma darwinii TaxID=43563 RepID=UPI003F6748C7